MVSSDDRPPIAANRRAGAAVQLQLRRTAAADHLDVAPEHALRVAGAERFHRRFFRGEPPGEMDGRHAAAHAVRDFALGEDAAEKPVAVALDRVGDAADVGGVEAETDDVWHDQG